MSGSLASAPRTVALTLARPTSAPAGRYARQAIDAARMWPSVQRKIVLADSARGALDLLLRDLVRTQ